MLFYQLCLYACQSGPWPVVWRQQCCKGWYMGLGMFHARAGLPWPQHVCQCCLTSGVRWVLIVGRSGQQLHPADCTRLYQQYSNGRSALNWSFSSLSMLSNPAHSVGVGDRCSGLCWLCGHWSCFPFLCSLHRWCCQGVRYRSLCCSALLFLCWTPAQLCSQATAFRTKWCCVVLRCWVPSLHGRASMAQLEGQHAGEVWRGQGLILPCSLQPCGCTACCCTSAQVISSCI